MLLNTIAKLAIIGFIDIPIGFKIPIAIGILKKLDIEINEDNSNDNSVNSAKIPVKRNIIPKDYVAFSSFYNNILINERYITIQIISYEEISTSINFLLKTKKKEDIVLQLNIF